MMSTRCIRSCIDQLARASGLVAAMQRRMCGGLTILTYHRVLTTERCRSYDLPELAIPAEVFREHVRMLAEHFEVLTLAGALTALSSPPRRDRALVAITFDDGYADIYETAVPILAQHGLRATFFPVTSFVAGRGPLWFDRLCLAVAGADPHSRQRAWDFANSRVRRQQPQLDRVATRSWVELFKCVPADARATAISMLEVGQGAVCGHEFAAMRPADVADLARRGHEVGSHSVSHAILTGVDDAQLERELGQSRSDLEHWTGATVTGLCYPNGDHDDRVVRAARAAGYEYACTTRAGMNMPDGDPGRLTRTDITMARVCTASGQHDPAAFMAEVCGLHELLRRVRGRRGQT